MDYKKILDRAGEVFIPEGGPFKLGGGNAGIGERFQYFVKAFGRKPVFTKIFLNIFNFLPFLFLYPRRFTSLSLDEREEIIMKLSTSRFSILRYIYILLRSLVFITFYSLEEVCNAIGYKTECEGYEGNRRKE